MTPDNRIKRYENFKTKSQHILLNRHGLQDNKQQKQ